MPAVTLPIAFAILASAPTSAEAPPVEIDALAMAALARSETPWRESEEFHLRIRAGAWFARLNGNLQVGSAGTTITEETTLNLNDSEAAFLGEAVATWHSFRAQLDGFSFATSGSATASTAAVIGPIAVAPGDILASTADLWSVGASIGYDFLRPYSDQVWPCSARSRRTSNVRSDGDYQGDLSFFGLVGGRCIGISQSINDQTSAQATSFDITAGYATVGGGLDVLVPLDELLPIGRTLSISGQAQWGTGFTDDQWMLAVQATLTVQFTDYLSAFFGYRLLDFNAVQGGNSLDGSLQGLTLGATLRF